MTDQIISLIIDNIDILYFYIGGIILLILYIHLVQRVEKIEQKLHNLSPHTKDISHHVTQVATSSNVSVAQKEIHNAQHTISDTDPVVRFFQWMAHDWPLKVGGLLLLMAVGWFVSYAFIHDWIGHVWRIFMGVCFGAILLFFGTLGVKKNQMQGNVFLIIGLISVLASILSGAIIYHLYIDIFALWTMFIVIVYVAYIGFQKNSLSLVSSTIVLSGLTPLFLLNRIDILMVLSYLLVISVGSLWVVYKKDWHELVLLSLSIVTGYALFFNFFKDVENPVYSLLFINLILLFFFFINILAIAGSRYVRKYDLWSVSFSVVLFFTLVLDAAPHSWYAQIFLLSALFFAIFAILTYVYTRFYDLVNAYSIATLVLLTASLSQHFEGRTLFSLVLIVVSAFIVYMLFLFQQKKQFKPSIIFGFVHFFIMLFFSLKYISDLIFNYRLDIKDIWGNLFIIFLYAFLSFVISGSIYFFSKQKEQHNRVFKDSMMFIGLLGIVYTLLLIWFTFHHVLFSRYIASMAALVVYSVVGVGLYVNGKHKNIQNLKYIGTSLLVIVLLRLFLVDFWFMDIIMRIITFFVVGILFMSTMFLGKETKKIM